MRSVGRGPNRDLLDAADTVSIAIAANLEVTIVTPLLAPRVANQIVIDTVLIGTVANAGDGMVELGSAVAGSDHTGFVVSELGRIGIDSDRDWTFGESSHELGLVIGLDRVDCGHRYWAIVVSEAELIHGDVWVVLLKADATIVKDVPHAVVLPTSTASERVSVAIDALLLR